MFRTSNRLPVWSPVVKSDPAWPNRLMFSGLGDDTAPLIPTPLKILGGLVVVLGIVLILEHAR